MNNKELISLEQAIVEGTDALISYKFDYPNTDYSVEVLLKPVNSKEMTIINAKSNVDTDTTSDLELLKASLRNMDGEPFSDEIIEKLPAGVVMDIAWKICDISGIDIGKINERTRSIDKLEGF